MKGRVDVELRFDQPELIIRVEREGCVGVGRVRGLWRGQCLAYS